MLVLRALVVGPMDLATASMAFKLVLLEEHAAGRGDGMYLKRCQRTHSAAFRGHGGFMVVC